MNRRRVRLGVNIDHVATIRNARGGIHPDPLRAAHIAASAGADGITAHLREDRRHISDEDIRRLRNEVFLPLNLEMAATPEMLAIACATGPARVCLVPEKRAELTTEGGLDLRTHRETVERAARTLADAGIPMTLFLDPDPDLAPLAREIGARAIELHTGLFAEAGFGERPRALAALRDAARVFADGGLEVHAGHGLSFETAGPVAAIPEVEELNIGHFLVGEALFTGLAQSIERMRIVIDAVMDTGRS